MANGTYETYPRTVEEMIEQGWYEKILAKVKKYHLNDILNTPEEIVQDIFVNIMSSRYLERYNPEMRSFEVYIYTMVINSIKKRGAREGSKNGRNIVNHTSLEYSQSDDEEMCAGITFLDRIENTEGQDAFREIELQDLFEATRQSLRAFKASSSVVYKGQVIQRDAETVFNLLLEDKTVPEIAEIFQTSKQFIYILLGKIRDTPEMQSFYNEQKRVQAVSNRGHRKKKNWTNAIFN